MVEVLCCSPINTLLPLTEPRRQHRHKNKTHNGDSNHEDETTNRTKNDGGSEREDQGANSGGGSDADATVEGGRSHHPTKRTVEPPSETPPIRVATFNCENLMVGGDVEC